MSANRLLEIRQKMNYSREQVAAEIGVSVNSIRNWETGEGDASQMSFENAVKLAECFDISLMALWQICSK